MGTSLFLSFYDFSNDISYNLYLIQTLLLEFFFSIFFFNFLNLENYFVNYIFKYFNIDIDVQVRLGLSLILSVK